MLFVIGLINILLGVIFGRRIRSKRSLLDAGTAYAKKTTHIDDIETGIGVTSHDEEIVEIPSRASARANRHSMVMRACNFQ